MRPFDAIIRAALRQRVLVLAGGLLVCGAAVMVASDLPVDVLPDLDRPTVTIMTEAQALSPTEVERFVTQPIETALLGTEDALRVRSTSAAGLSIVVLELDWGASVLAARQRVSERLATVELPPDVTPIMGPVTSIMGEIMLIAVTSKDAITAPLELRALADTTLTRALARIPGVAQVVAIGGGPKTLRVSLVPRLMGALGVSLDEVMAAVRGAQGVTSGGFAERHGDELVVRNVARADDPKAVGETVVARRGDVIVRLADVATIAFEAGVTRGEAGLNGAPAVMLAVQKQPGASTLAVTTALHATLATLSRQLAADVTLTPVFEQSAFIEAATNNVAHALRDGALLVVIILVLFLQSVRTTFITLTALPLSLAVTVLVFAALDLSVNTMTLGGVAVAIGELVDDAVVDVENVFRRLRENRVIGRPILDVVWRASREVRGSIVFATALVVLVFVPLFGLGGVEGKLFAPLGVAYIVSILGSLLVSLTVTPVLASLLLPNAPATRRGDGLLVRGLKAVQRRVLTVTLAAPALPLAAAALLTLGAVGLVSALGSEFLPPFNEGTLTVNVLARPGTALSDGDAIGRAAERLVLDVPEVVAVGRRTGRAEQDEHAEGPHSSELDVRYTLGERPRAQMIADVRERLATLPGVVTSIGQPISHRLDHLLAGVRAPIAIKVRGPDLDLLVKTAARIESVARNVPGLVDVRAEPLVEVPTLALVPRPDAARLGFAPGAFADALAALVGGATAGRVQDADRQIPLEVRLAAATREDPAALGAVMIDTPANARVPLRALVDVREERAPSQINREGGERRIAVLANVTGRDLGATVADLEAALAEVPLPSGTTLALEGQHQSQAAASARIVWLALVAFAAMVLVLWVHFRALRFVVQVLLNIPLALVGSALALWLADLPLSVATLVGFITLCGIASRNSILLIDHYLMMMRDEGAPFSIATLVKGSLDRLVPVLMTALTAAIGLVPLALASDAPGNEILHPVAVVILGGLVSSTLLDLVVTPAAFWLFGRGGKAYQEPRDAS